MTEKQAEKIIDLLTEISNKLSDIESSTSGTEHNVSMLEYKFDEIKNALED